MTGNTPRAIIKHRGARLARGLTARYARLRYRVSSLDWSALRTELDAWRSSGIAPNFWWRDDDATQATDALDRLLKLAAEWRVPISLAVIPETADETLSARLREEEEEVWILQHGWSHTNYNQGRYPPAELSDSRDVREVRLQLAEGFRRLRRLFGAKLLPVLVPPCNYLALHLAPVVREDYSYISVFGDFTGLLLESRNVHVDLIDWRTRSCVNVADVIRSLLLALKLRRWGVVQVSSPIGIMTHHLDHDSRAWSLLESVMENLVEHGSVCFPRMAQVFANSTGSSLMGRRR